MKTPNPNPGSVQPGINDKCPYCGMIGHTPMVCPRVRAFEFNPDGSVKRVEFITPAPVVSGPIRMTPGHPFTATSSDDSPAPTDKRPWPKVTWVAYDDAGRLERADIQTPDGQLFTLIAPGDGQIKPNFFIRSTISSGAGAILEVMVADRDGKEHGWFTRSTAAQKP